MNNWLERKRQIILGFALGLTILLAAIILIAILAPASQEDTEPSIHSTATPNPTSNLPAEVTTATPSPPIGISREKIQSAFEDAGYGFDSHGPQWVSGTFFDGTGSGIMLDIFGPAHDVEAVELTFSLNSIFDDGVHETAIALSGELLLLTVATDWIEGPSWFTENVALFGTRGDEDIQMVRGGRLFTLVFASERKLGGLLIEGQ